MATTFLCPKGHSSADNDFCSECGAKIVSASADATNGDVNGAACPDCGAPPPAPGVNFCEICGYNFITRTSGDLALAKSTRPVPPPPTPTVSTTLTLAISVDPTLRNPSSPEAPSDVAPVSYPVAKPANLIGRRSETRAIFPEIALDYDSAVSHRHGIISQTPEGVLMYRDLGSSNGTRLNGAELTPLVDTALKPGDELTLGHWTRITVSEN